MAFPMDLTFAGPRLERIEQMLVDIHGAVFQGSAAFLPPPGLAPSTSEQGPYGVEQDLAAPKTPSTSRARRLRSKHTKQKLWNALNNVNVNDPPTDDEKPMQKRARHHMEVTEEKFETRAKEAMAAAKVRQEEQSLAMVAAAETRQINAMEERFADLIKTIQADTFVTEMTKILQGNGAIQRERCHKCGMDDGRCFCEELGCKRCLHTAIDCSCQIPRVLKWRCIDCSANERDINWWGSEPLQTTEDDELSCWHCGSTRFAPPDPEDEAHMIEGFPLNGAHPCVICRKIDAQWSLEECIGRGCHSLFHDRCATSELCPACTQSGNVPSSEDEDEGEDDFSMSDGDP